MESRLITTVIGDATTSMSYGLQFCRKNVIKRRKIIIDLTSVSLRGLVLRLVCFWWSVSILLGQPRSNQHLNVLTNETLFPVNDETSDVDVVGVVEVLPLAEYAPMPLRRLVLCC